MGISRSANRIPEALGTSVFLDLLIPQPKVGQNFYSLQCTLTVYLYADTLVQAKDGAFCLR